MDDEIRFILYTDEYKSFLLQMKNELDELKKETHEDFIGVDPKKIRLIILEDKAIGFCNVHYVGGIPNLEIALLKEFQGKGLGTKVIGKLKALCFEEGNSLVQLLIHKKNKTSQEMALRAGFRMVDDNEEFNLLNKEDTYYTYIARNYLKTNDRAHNRRY